MKLTLLAALLAIAAPAFAANDHAGHGPMHSQAAADSQLADGLIKKVDQAAGKVTISHGPLPNGMPAMTMVFRLKDAAWAAQMKEGDKIRFKADSVNGAMTVVRFEPVK